MTPSLAICKIWQKDNHAFSIEWNDGIVQDFPLFELQKNCPCAGCNDEMTGKKLVDPRTIPENLKAKVIRNAGRYGIRIQFTSGCSMGIYSFERLRQLGR